jgi:hypothetical protein
MTKFPPITVTVRNTKTNTYGFAVCAYNRTNDGKGMVEVFTGKGKNAYWLAAHTEFEPAE